MINHYKSVLHPVKGRGVPPVSFLETLVAVVKAAPDSLFATNSDPEDVYNRLAPVLGPWTGPLHRRAAMAELLRCLAGFESSWKWGEGVDKSNKTSQKDPRCEETGIFQISFNVIDLDIKGPDKVDDIRQCILKYCGDLNVQNFIDRVKGPKEKDHEFAVILAITALRNNFFWDGPISRHEIDSSLYRPAVEEFMLLLK